MRYYTHAVAVPSLLMTVIGIAGERACHMVFPWLVCVSSLPCVGGSVNPSVNQCLVTPSGWVSSQVREGRDHVGGFVRLSSQTGHCVAQTGGCPWLRCTTPGPCCVWEICRRPSHVLTGTWRLSARRCAPWGSSPDKRRAPGPASDQAPPAPASPCPHSWGVPAKLI